MIGPINQELKSPELVDLPVSAWGQLFKTEKVKYIQFVDTKKIGTEDLLFQIMTYGQCSSFYYIDRPFYHYRRSDYGTLTTKYMPEKFERWQRLYCIIEKIIADRNYDGVYREAFNHRVCYSMIGLGLNEILSNEGCWAQSKSIKRILDSDRYAKAYKEIDLKILPIHWKVFFGLCKYRQTFALVMMLHIIEFLRKKVF